MTGAMLEYKPPDCSANTPAMLMLHGLGASGADLYPIAQHIGGGRLRVLFPDAPRQAVTVNGGMEMPAWYDIAGVNLEDRQDVAGILESSARIDGWLAELRQNGATTIYLAGFSQGAAMSVHAGLRHAHALAGIIVLSGYMLRGETLQKEAAAANRNTPIFMAHGVYDSVVLPQWARQCHEALTAGGWPVSFTEYPAAHAIPPAAVADLDAWLRG